MSSQSHFHDGTIFTREDGTPIPRPSHSEFPPGVDGDIAWLEALYNWKTEITELANKSFADQLRKSLRDV